MTLNEGIFNISPRGFTNNSQLEFVMCNINSVIS